MTEIVDDRTHDLEFAAERIGGSRDWVMRQLRKGRFPGRKVGHQWRMTESDILASIQIVARPARPVDLSGLTATSRERLATSPDPAALTDFAAGLTTTSRRRLTRPA
ncbi:helix-turn-helix domain-containing protein [Nocardia niigatensis]